MDFYKKKNKLDYKNKKVGKNSDNDKKRKIY